MVYCICGKDKGGFMVLCDGCNVWFHGSCVKETAKTTKNISKWYCAWCDRCTRSFTVLRENNKRLCLDVDAMRKEFKTVAANAKELHDSLMQDHNILKTRFDSLSKNYEDLVTLKTTNEHLREELNTAVATMNETHVPKELYDSLMQEHNNLKTRFDSLTKKNEDLVCLRNENEHLREELKTAVAAMNETHVSKELHDSLMEEHHILKTRFDSLSKKNEELVCLRNENEKLKLEIEELNGNSAILRQEKIDLQKTLKLHRGKRLSLSQK